MVKVFGKPTSRFMGLGNDVWLGFELQLCSSKSSQEDVEARL